MDTLQRNFKEKLIELDCQLARAKVCLEDLQLDVFKLKLVKANKLHVAAAKNRAAIQKLQVKSKELEIAIHNEQYKA